MECLYCLILGEKSEEAQRLLESRIDKLGGTTNFGGSVAVFSAMEEAELLVGHTVIERAIMSGLPPRPVRRNPYTVVRPMRGSEHYGRKKLIEYLLTVQDSATWVVGTHRMGKTSLLRQVEWSILQGKNVTYVPLYWDIRACESAEDLANALFSSINDEADRFRSFGIDQLSFHNADIIHSLQYLQQALSKQGKQLLLLIDEAEALVTVARQNPIVLTRIRHSMQSGEFRTIMTATKNLIQLNDLMRKTISAPFLSGFRLVNLWKLDLESTQAMIIQQQNEYQVEVSAKLIAEIIAHTNGHPYLTQFLCHRLFETNGIDRSWLRDITAKDMQVDYLLAGFFQMDFDHLSPSEKQILLAVARHEVVNEETLSVDLNILPDVLKRFVYGMNKLGYLRQIMDGWSIGNKFLRRWVLENQYNLAR